MISRQANQPKQIFWNFFMKKELWNSFKVLKIWILWIFLSQFDMFVFFFGGVKNWNKKIKYFLLIVKTCEIVFYKKKTFVVKNKDVKFELTQLCDLVKKTELIMQIKKFKTWTNNSRIFNTSCFLLSSIRCVYG